VIEDNHDTQKAVALLFRDQKVNLTYVETGAAARKALAEAEYDVIILDLSLPDIAGEDFAEELATGSTSEIPIVVYTSASILPEETQRLCNRVYSVVTKGTGSSKQLVEDVLQCGKTKSADTTAHTASDTVLHTAPSTAPSTAPTTALTTATGTDPETIHSYDLEGLKVLVVDDDARNIFAMSRILADEGMVIESAVNGKMGLEKLEKYEDFDLVLMDIMMPVMGGLEAMQEIRKIDKFRELPIIALTAKAMAGDREECLDAGASEYVSKPIDPKLLLSTSQKLLSGTDPIH